MKKIIFFIGLMFFVFSPSWASAELRNSVNGYFYLYSEETLEHQYLTLPDGSTSLDASKLQNEAQILGLKFEIRGEHDSIFIEYQDGSIQEVTGDSVVLNVPTSTVSVFVNKMTNEETYIRLVDLSVLDTDAQNKNIVYEFKDLPTLPEDFPTYKPLGSTRLAGSGLDLIPHESYPTSDFKNSKFYYLEHRDSYRLDLWQNPSKSTSVKIIFTADSGLKYERIWPIDEVGGTLYLTCKGKYDLQFLNDKGRIIKTARNFKTPEIKNSVCTSFPEPVPKDDLNAKVELPACSGGVGNDDLPKASWTAKDGADHYDIYKDGEKVGTTTGTEIKLPGGGGSYTIVAKDPSGNVVGESDVNTNYIDSINGSGSNSSVCACIAELSDVMDEIGSYVYSIHEDLHETNKLLGDVKDKLDGVNDRLDGVKDALDEVVRQITPTREYPLPKPIQTPELYKPSDVMDQKYENKKTYFTDQGDAPVPDAMPIAPEPADWEVNGQKMKPQAEIKPDTPLISEPVLNQDAVLQKEADLKADSALIPDPVLKQNEVIPKDPELKADQYMEADQQEYELRWNSSQYP